MEIQLANHVQALKRRHSDVRSEQFSFLQFCVHKFDCNEGNKLLVGDGTQAVASWTFGVLPEVTIRRNMRWEVTSSHDLVPGDAFIIRDDSCRTPKSA